MPNDNSKRGFGSMDEKKQHDIASKGGKSSHGGRSASSGGTQSKSAGSRGGSHEQHVKAGQQSHKNS